MPTKEWFSSDIIFPARIRSSYTTSIVMVMLTCVMISMISWPIIKVRGRGVLNAH